MTPEMPNRITDPEIAVRLLEWYARRGRDLPWRRTRDPYRIWISEVILQQTRVAQGTAYYHRFLTEFPDLLALASAPEDRVLKCWQGLGYYSRAQNLRTAARQIVERHGGVFPVAYADVRALCGVGDYTAAAICSIAYDAPYAAVDGNVYRVLARLYDLDEAIDTTAGRRSFAALADGLIDRRQPGRYNQAIMDFGALCCLPAQPRCGECPFRDRCLALAAGTVMERPRKQGKAAVSPRYFNYLHVECGAETVLCRRDTRDIWRGLYEFPLVESERPLEYDELAATAAFRALFDGAGNVRLLATVAMPVHRLSHRAIHAVFHRVAVECWPESLCGGIVVAVDRLGDYAVPRLVERYLSR